MGYGTKPESLESGKLYFLDQEGGSSVYLGNVEKLEITESDNTYVDPDIFPIRMPSPTSMEVTLTSDSSSLLFMMYIYNRYIQTVLKLCPNKRVTYLIRYAKKMRARKKNFNRAIRILKKEI